MKGVIVRFVLFALFFSSVFAVSSLPWARTVFSVEANRYIIVDEKGREIILRGANVENELREWPKDSRPIDPAAYDGICPKNDAKYSEPPICELDAGRGVPPLNRSTAWNSSNDFSQMRAWGFNAIRLCISWEQLEPTPGVYSTQYLDRVEQMVGWAAEQGIYTILDMHEDWYTHWLPVPAREYPPYLTFSYGQDGAPSWAVDANGYPSLAPFSFDPLNPAMMSAFDAFYNNKITANSSIVGEAPGPGLQDHFIGAIAALARRFVNCSAVLGFEILNEPQLGSMVLHMLDFSAQHLYPLYSRVIQAITGTRDGLPTCTSTVPPRLDCSYPDLGIHDTRHLMMFEPSAIRNQFDFALQRSKPFTDYPNIVYTPHAYTHVFTLDRVLKIPVNSSHYPPSYDFAFETAHAEALMMRAALLITEYGVSPDQDGYVLVNMTRAQETSRTGSTVWSWKSNGGGDNGWCLYDQSPSYPDVQNGPEIASRIQYLARIAPRFVVGHLHAYSYTPPTMISKSANGTAQFGTDAKFVLRASYVPSSSSSSSSRKGASNDADDSLLTEIIMPAAVVWSLGGAAHVDVSVTGAVDPASIQMLQYPDGSQLLTFAPNGAGEYSVLVLSKLSSSASVTHSRSLAGESAVADALAFDRSVARRVESLKATSLTGANTDSDSDDEAFVASILRDAPSEIFVAYEASRKFIGTLLADIADWFGSPVSRRPNFATLFGKPGVPQHLGAALPPTKRR